MRFASILLAVTATGAAAAAFVWRAEAPAVAGSTGLIDVVPAARSSAIPVAIPTFAAPVVADPRATPSTSPVSTLSAPRASTAGTWWKPAIGDTWQWQLSGTINTGYDVAIYDVDLFDTPAATVARLRADGRRIICYFSAGSSENWRNDFKQFAKADMGRPLDGWPGERWIDTRSPNVRRIMTARLDLARSRGCDGVETDNMDGYANRNGLGLTAENQLDYNRFLADGAHARGLAIGLKNDLAQVKALEPSFDYAVNEQCNQYKECRKLAPFTLAGKPVFNAEYAVRYRDDRNGARETLCTAMRAARIRTLVLPLKLNDKYRYTCDAPTA